MADKLNDKQKKRFRDAFATFDKNGDGTITAAELGEVMKSVGQNPTEADLKELIKLVDVDGSGSISFDEFMIVMLKALKTIEEQLRLAFKEFDKDGSGSISKGEVKKVWEEYGAKLSDKELDEMMKEADADKDGTVNYEEFVEMCWKYW